MERYICPICKREFTSLLGLSIHYTASHGDIIKFKKYWLYERFGYSVPKCIYCDNEVKIDERNYRKHITCSNLDCVKKYHASIQHKVYETHPELREIHRKKRLEYLCSELHYEKTAWGIRSSKQHSFLEQWFIDNVINKHILYEKYDIINEYCEYPYFLDFAFLNIKVDVELDGRCHFNNGTKRIKHDIVRDDNLKKNGWYVYRISYFDVETNPIKIENDFVNFIQTYNSEKHYSYNNVIPYTSFNNDRKNNIQKIKNEEKAKNDNAIKEMLLDLQNNSHIDFCKFGWLNEAHKYLCEKFKQIYRNNHSSTLRRYIKTHYSDFFNNVDTYKRS